MTIIVSEDTLRFRAGPEPKTVNATYEVEDSTGQRDAGYVTIRILPRDDDANAAPRPRDVTVRTLSGSGVQVAIDLDGIDADGDSVPDSVTATEYSCTDVTGEGLMSVSSTVLTTDECASCPQVPT